ncbi:ankyrin repeat-containing domain protein, partial [Lasiosphaeria miniovina]
QTPLIWAAASGHDTVVELLLAAENVDYDWKDDSGRTALSWAVANGHEAVIKLLLATGRVDVNSRDNNDKTPL